MFVDVGGSAQDNAGAASIAIAMNDDDNFLGSIFAYGSTLLI
jgi:hypothetical protein